MAKLNSVQKEQFFLTSEMLGDYNMRVFYSRELRMMVGIMPEADNGMIHRMFVTLCHGNDQFKKKLGLIELCRKFEDDNFNQVRILGGMEFFVRDYMELFANFGDFDFQELELN